jgi:hypothetical protein
VSFLACGVASAGTYHASNAAGLEAAVADADESSAASTIYLAGGQYLPISTLAIRADVTIIGPASSPGAMIGGDSVAPYPSDLLLVERHGKLTLWNVELYGADGEGAAALDDYGSVDVESSALAGNTGIGMWVQVEASATVSDSTIVNGRAFGVVNDGRATLLSSTVAGNVRGGIENSGRLSLTNTIVAENGQSSTGARGMDCVGKANESDHSLDSDGTCGVGALGGRDPLLGKLAANGGPTPTEALQTGSPAIGAGDASKCTREDERHYTRPPGVCDIGAYQSGASQAGGGGGSSGPSGGTGSAGGGAALLAVSAHGSLRGRRGSRITFKLSVHRGRAPASITYREAARRLSLRALRISSLAFDSLRGLVTVRGTVKTSQGARRVAITIVLVRHGGVNSVRLRLGSGYYESSTLRAGAITFTIAST